MKELKSRFMKKILKMGINKAKNKRIPSDGFMSPLYTWDLANGWHYQVDFVNDSRYKKTPFVSVYAFPPGIAQEAKYYLIGYLNG